MNGGQPARSSGPVDGAGQLDASATDRFFGENAGLDDPERGNAGDRAKVYVTIETADALASCELSRKRAQKIADLKLSREQLLQALEHKAKKLMPKDPVAKKPRGFFARLLASLSGGGSRSGKKRSKKAVAAPAAAPVAAAPALAAPAAAPTPEKGKTKKKKKDKAPAEAGAASRAADATSANAESAPARGADAAPENEAAASAPDGADPAGAAAHGEAGADGAPSG